MRARVSDGNGHGIEQMSYADLLALQNRLAGLIAEKKLAEKIALREKFASMARKQGFDIQELVGRPGRGRSGKVAPKYADPANPENTWTGRGREPRWMQTALKGGKAKRDDFLIA